MKMNDIFEQSKQHKLYQMSKYCTKLGFMSMFANMTKKKNTL